MLCKILRYSRIYLLFILSGWLTSCTYYMGVNRFERSFRKDDSFIFERKTEPNSCEQAFWHQNIVKQWAEKQLPDWQQQAKVSANRVLMTKVALKSDPAEVNRYVLNAVPNAKSGTKWFMNPKGDYDFTEIALSFILNKYGNDTTRIFPDVARHLAMNLIVSEGGDLHLFTPGTVWTMRETENHILMGNIGLYLKNQWVFANLYQEKKYDNQLNGVEDFLTNHLRKMLKTGFYEFNSDPYSGYSLTALLILHSCAESDELRQLSEQILDNVFYKYAHTSLHFRYYPPMRRRMERAGDPGLDRNPVNSLAQTLFALQAKGNTVADFPAHNHHQALIAVLSDYRLPEEILQIMGNPPGEYLLKVGHGPKSSPEIVSRGSGFMLTAGGVQPGKVSQVGARPITLLTHNDAMKLDEIFHIKSEKEMSKWNHTGVWHRLAVAEGKVHVPESAETIAEAAPWMVFYQDSLFVAVYQGENFGLMATFPSAHTEGCNLLIDLMESNPEASLEDGVFVFPDTQTTVKFDVSARKNRWVVMEVDSLQTDRKIFKWKRWNKQLFNQPQE
jgi:hypothetical protein